MYVKTVFKGVTNFKNPYCVTGSWSWTELLSSVGWAAVTSTVTSQTIENTQHFSFSLQFTIVLSYFDLSELFTKSYIILNLLVYESRIMKIPGLLDNPIKRVVNRYSASLCSI